MTEIEINDLLVQNPGSMYLSGAGKLYVLVDAGLVVLDAASFKNPTAEELTQFVKDSLPVHV